MKISIALQKTNQVVHPILIVIKIMRYAPQSSLVQTKMRLRTPPVTPAIRQYLQFIDGVLVIVHFKGTNVHPTTTFKLIEIRKKVGKEKMLMNLSWNLYYKVFSCASVGKLVSPKSATPTDKIYNSS